MIQTGSRVRHVSNPDSVICEVIEVKDFGRGEDNKRVQIRLPILGLTRYYAVKELEEILEEDKHDRTR